ncbi:MAG: hypothetical protein ABI140_10240, partial [Jatrophihabitantaceae bacterium]
LMLLAVLAFAAGRLAASSQSHAYDPGASPPASFQLTNGKLYQLSAPGGVPALRKLGLLTDLACTWSTDGQQLTPLAIADTFTDDRDLLSFATFNSPVTGRVSITCTGVSKVFVDDADNAGFDRNAPLLLLSVLLGLIGVIVAVSGWYGLGERAASGYRDARLFDTFDDRDAR